MNKPNLFYPLEMRVAPSLNETLPVNPPQSKYALLINPFYPKDPHASFGKHVLTPSLALTSIAASTPEDWQVDYWDENLLQGHPPYEPFPAVVGITVHLTFAKRAFALAEWYRKRGALIVLGGLHVMSCEEECVPHADVLAIGEGVQLWGRILHDIAHGTVQKRYTGSYRLPYREEPFPRRDILPKRDFLTTASLIATRGCHSRCDFCYLSTNQLFMPYQMKTPQQVVQEFMAIPEPYGVFIDNNLGSNRKYLHALCRELQSVNRIWSAAVSIDVTEDPALIREMALAGCMGVFVGFETLNGVNIQASGKKSPHPEDYARRVQMFHEHGIQVNGSFVLGFDEDGPDVFRKTVQWVEENRLECATFHILTPYPGTPLFRKMKAEGRLLHENWECYDTAHVVFRPKNMTIEELEEGYQWCYQRLFSHGSIWKRRPQQLISVPGYLGMSYLYKRSNRIWHFLIRHRLTHLVWYPLIELTRWRIRLKRQLMKRQSLVNHLPLNEPRISVGD